MSDTRWTLAAAEMVTAALLIAIFAWVHSSAGDISTKCRRYRSGNYTFVYQHEDWTARSHLVDIRKGCP